MSTPNFLTPTTNHFLLELANSAEYQAISAEAVMLDLFYVGLLNRAPGAEGYAYWQEELADADTPLTYFDVFLSSQEYQDRFLPTDEETAALNLVGVAAAHGGDWGGS
ncbi:hypothetical protein Thiowin_04665 [Thiorhodovibrio winogradskyi]|uniref:DUF4214 domain-containing protein n=1 Tax=Thiorhodovibrio winogradskyi TaxID=77007 RepID=A0ABZ0SFT9_9GAMM|nr:DUF4214 domain-containing protein [Thiorhodovibrio winogradskyi]